ncbi:hypothetical protein BV20DRAFT_375622 [Pilatotrama ljubarskyi]|nr:hypothetical protein BV20DRAFT_375622 [Pilatotrama ljubarskyi]
MLAPGERIRALASAGLAINERDAAVLPALGERTHSDTCDSIIAIGRMCALASYVRTNDLLDESGRTPRPRVRTRIRRQTIQAHGPWACARLEACWCRHRRSRNTRTGRKGQKRYTRCLSKTLDARKGRRTGNGKSRRGDSGYMSRRGDATGSGRHIKEGEGRARRACLVLPSVLAVSGSRSCHRRCHCIIMTLSLLRTGLGTRQMDGIRAAKSQTK